MVHLFSTDHWENVSDQMEIDQRWEPPHLSNKIAATTVNCECAQFRLCRIGLKMKGNGWGIRENIRKWNNEEESSIRRGF